MKIIRFVLIFVLIISIAVMSAGASQYGNDFNYKDVKELEDDDWTVSNEDAVSFPGNGIILDGSKGTVTLTYTGIPSGVVDWQVGARCTWLGGGGSSWLDLMVFCNKHRYILALDGATSQFQLLRDDKKVIAVDGYSGAANTQEEFYLRITGGTIEICYNSKVIGSYTEAEPSAPAIVSITSPTGSAALYSWAGADITTHAASSGDAGSDTPDAVPDTPADVPATPDIWSSFDPAAVPDTPALTGNDVGVQSNPGDSVDPTAISEQEQIEKPPVPDNEEETSSEPSTINQTADTASASQSEQPYEKPIWIVINTGTFVLNTDNPQKNYGASAELGQYTFDGIGKMHNVFTADMDSHAACQQEQNMHDAGLTAPESHLHDYNPYDGNIPDYYLTMDTHVSGDFSTEATANAAVAFFTVTITDSGGNVVWSNKITANATEGKSLDYYHCALAKQADAWLQSVVNRKITH